ncbi:MAG: hypothetical protein RL330_586 [Actinomycetota bacterium]
MRRSGSGWGHLVRRFVGAISHRAPSATAQSEVRALLTAPEWWMWSRMSGRDRRHSIEVLKRFDSSGVHAARDVRAAVLLHDAGKTSSGLGLCMTVIATLVGPRGRRFTAYHDHEAIGARQARDLGVDDGVLAVLEGRAEEGILRRLRAADEM